MYFRDIKEATRYCKEHGAEHFTKAQKVGGVQYYICPLCGSGTGKNHSSGKGDGAVTQGTKNASVFTCFSCHFSGDVIAWIAKEHKDISETSQEAFDLAYKAFNIEIGKNTRTSEKNSPEEPQCTPEGGESVNYMSLYARASARLRESNYLQQRGISLATAAKYTLGYTEYFFTGLGHKELGLIIPLSKTSYSVRNTNSATASQQRYQKKGGACLFNAKALLNSQEPVFITEGELDALSIIEAGGQAVALGSTSNISLLVTLLQVNKPDKGIILCMDNDSAGKNAVKNYFDLLKEKKLSVLTYIINVSGEYKDANEALVKGKNAFVKVVQAAKDNPKLVQYRQQRKNDSERLAVWWENIHNKEHGRVIPTGFKGLDEALGGGLGSGFIGIGAIPALGKTTLAVQIANNIAKTGNDVLIFTLELDSEELISKTISRLTAQNSVAIYGNTSKASTSREIMQAWRWATMDAKKQDLIYYSRRQYEEYAEHIYTIEGEMDYTLEQLQQVVEEHIIITGNKPVVFVDYLQILGLQEKEDRGLTDKAKADKLVKYLRKLAKRFDIPLVVISSFNRDNYNAPVSFSAFKESGGIEYGADFLIGLQMPFMEIREAGGQPEDARSYQKRIWLERRQAEQNKKAGKAIEVEAVVLKSRYSGGGRACFSFLPKYNLFADADRAPNVPEVNKSLFDASRGRGNVVARDILKEFIQAHTFDADVVDASYYGDRVQVKFVTGCISVYQANENRQGQWSVRDVNTCQIFDVQERPLTFNDYIEKD